MSGGTIQSDGATVGALEPGGGGALIGGLTVLSGDFPEGTTLDGGVFSAADADEVTLLAGALDLFGESDGSTVECDVSCVPRNGIGAETLTTASYVSDQPSLS